MSPWSLGLLGLAIVAEVAATMALKASAGFARPGPGFLALAGYAVAFFCMSLAMRTVPVGIIYALWSGIGIVLIAAASWLLHGETLDAPALVGVGLILAGVLVINLLSGSVGS